MRTIVTTPVCHAKPDDLAAEISNRPQQPQPDDLVGVGHRESVARSAYAGRPCERPQDFGAVAGGRLKYAAELR